LSRTPRGQPQRITMRNNGSHAIIFFIVVLTQITSLRSVIKQQLWRVWESRCGAVGWV